MAPQPLYSSPASLSIPLADWREASRHLEQERKKKKKNQRKRGVVGLAHFTYSLKDQALVKSSSEEPCSLFWNYIQATEENLSERYLVLQMDDENTEALTEELREAAKGRTNYSYDTDHLREKILLSGIRVEKVSNAWTHFHYMGSSNSQVQRHVYVFRQANALLENQDRIKTLLPEVASLASIPKRVKYTGLLFSGISPVELPDDLTVKEIHSVKNQKFDFTDGPGLISLKLAQWIAQKLKYLSEKNPPSVFQIRYCGSVKRLNGEEQGYVCKGVLLVDPRNTSTYEIQVRESMLKTKASLRACNILQNTLGICADSSRTSPGRLGQQMICLLSDTVSNTDFKSLQREYSEHALNCSTDVCSMAWMLAMNRKRGIGYDFQKLVEQCLDKTPASKNLDSKQSSRQSLDALVPSQIINQRSSVSSSLSISSPDDKLLSLYKKCASSALPNTWQFKNNKAQIPIAASRNLFGASFPETLHEHLDEGECVVMLENGPLSCANGKETFVIVSRSPSYHPGDIRVLRVKPLPLGHPVLSLRNCILFATRGYRPDPDKMGGGDLDGDMFLVIWHPTLLKYARNLKAISPAAYEDPPKRKGNGAPLKQAADLIHYVAQTDNSLLGEVETSFYKVAKRFGVSSNEICTLNQLFASLVDRNPASIDRFQELKGTVQHESHPHQDCVWEILGKDQGSLTKEVEKHNNQLRDSQQLAISFDFFQKSLKTNMKTTYNEKLTLLHQHFQWAPNGTELEATLKSSAFMKISQNDAPGLVSTDIDGDIEDAEILITPKKVS